jgi:hypothetical protein
MNPTQAIRNRDPDALDQAFDSVEEASTFRSEVLPTLSPDDCRWFWQQVMSPEQFHRTFEAMREVVLAIAQSHGLVPGQVQGGHVDDTPVVYATPRARALIFDEIPCERHSFLNALLIPLDTDELF